MIIVAAVIITLVYLVYQIKVVQPRSMLVVPALAYPQTSVYYRYLAQGGIQTNFGDQSLTSSQIDEAIEKDMKDIKSTGFDAVKLSYSFQGNNTLVDQIAIKAAEQGLYPIATLQGGQAASRDAFTVDEMNQWQDFVRSEVDINKNRTYYWEIWGEPSLYKYGTPEEFVQLLKATYPIIKSANPNAKVIVTLGADGRDTNFEDQVLALGGGDYFDDLSFHPYGANPYLQEEMVNNAITYEKSVEAKYNNKWLLVITEIGQPTSEVSETEQARLAAFLYIQATKSNIPVTWFYWSDQRLPKNQMSGDGSNWGLIRYDGTARPIIDAIKPYLNG